MCLALLVISLVSAAIIAILAVVFWPVCFIGIVGLPICIIILTGFTTNPPNQALVFLLFGKYYGTLAKAGFFWINPLTDLTHIISLKSLTLDNNTQKVNDLLGNPIEIGVVVVWRAVNTTKAIFNVENYSSYLSTVADSAIRNVARRYPYDMSEHGEEKSLRGSSTEIAQELQREIQERVEIAGLEILEARISRLNYASEIASSMLQRQQAVAVVAARQKIVEGAVGMVHMALDQIGSEGKVEFTPEKKAQMVANLLVVLCGGRDAQPTLSVGA
jgi:regulator of protease activity HflC (stomatin/prohibitin superfamily)